MFPIASQRYGERAVGGGDEAEDERALNILWRK